MVERVVVGPWKTNCYIYSSTKKECIIIDPGGSESEIASRVDVLNMVPVGIALTHGHVDHLAALGKLRDSYAARGYKLPIAINPLDRRFLGTGGRETHRENLEFLGLDERSQYSESDLESAIIGQIERFLLEMGPSVWRSPARARNYCWRAFRMPLTSLLPCRTATTCTGAASGR